MLAWRWIRMGEIPTPDQYLSFLNIAPMRPKHLMRLWASADYEFMESMDCPRLLATFCRQRRRVRRLTLRELRREFQAVTTVASMFAPLRTARELDLATTVLQWRVCFGYEFAIGYLSSLPLLDRLDFYSPEALGAILTTARESTRALLAMLTDGDMASLRELILPEASNRERCGVSRTNDGIRQSRVKRDIRGARGTARM